MNKSEYIIKRIKSGKLSIGRAAELLRTSVQDMHRLAEKHGVRLGATKEQEIKSSETLKKLLKK